jgi:hypothetical protein
MLSALVATSLIVLAGISGLSGRSDESRNPSPAHEMACSSGEIAPIRIQRILRAEGMVGGPARVVACRGGKGRPVALVTYRDGQNLCFVVARLSTASLKAGQCNPLKIPWSHQCLTVCVTVVGTDSRAGRYRHTALVGEAGKSVNRVLIMSKAGQSSAMSALANKNGAGRLGTFVIFGAILPRCIPGQALRVVAMNKQGEVLGSVHGEGSRTHSCSLPEAPG